MFKYMIGYIKAKLKILSFFAIVAFLTTGLSIVLPYYNGRFIDSISYKPNKATVVNYAIFIAILLISSIFINYLYGILNTKIKLDLSYNMYSDIISHIQKIPYIVYKKYNPTYLNQRINTDIARLWSFFLVYFINIFIQALSLIILIILIFELNVYIFVSYKFEKGNIYLIEGKNGSGKTTLLLLLIGMLQEQGKGDIYFNNVSISDVNMKSLRSSAIEFIQDIMDESGLSISEVANSGNIVIDSLLGYWYVTAQKKGIDFSLDIKIPMKMEFKGADICLILGNLLENAVEAAERVRKKKYIKIQMKYDKGNLLIFLMNSYQGRLIKMKDERLKSTKSDAGNHGVGLPSVYRAAAKYNGTVTVDDSIPERFLVRVVLYGEKE